MTTDWHLHWLVWGTYCRFTLTRPLQTFAAFPWVSGLRFPELNNSVKCHYESCKCGECNPPFTFFSKMLFFDCVTGCDKAYRDVTRCSFTLLFITSDTLAVAPHSLSQGPRKDGEKTEGASEGGGRDRGERIFTTQTAARVSCITMSVPLQPRLKSSLRREGMSLCGAFAGNAGLKVFRCDSSCAVSITEKPNITHTGALVGKNPWNRIQCWTPPYSLSIGAVRFIVMKHFNLMFFCRVCFLSNFSYYFCFTSPKTAHSYL